MSELTGRQRKYLRGLAHSLEPLVRIGRAGLSDSVFANLDESLEHHELVKVKFIEWKEQKAELTAQMVERLGCENAGGVGHTVILYRAARTPEKRQIRLPKAGS